MFAPSWFWHAARPKTPARRSWGFRPCLETLEERAVPSTVNPTPMDNAHLIASAGRGAAARLFVIGSDGGLFMQNGSNWTQIGAAGTIRQVTAVTETPRIPGAVGAPNPSDAVAFVVTANGALARFSDGSGWQLIGGPGTIRSASAGTDQRGLADVFVLTTGGQLTEWSGSSGWAARPIGAAGTVLSMSAFANDSADVVTADHSVFRFTPGAGWERLAPAGFARDVETDTNGNAVVRTFDGGLALRTAQPPGNFTDSSGWTRLGAPGSIRLMSAGTDSFNRPDVFVVTGSGGFAEFSAASGWQVVAGAPAVQRMSAGADGHVFTVASDGSVAEHDGQTGWLSLAGPGFASIQPPG